jgi:hypothetical protein
MKVNYISLSEDKTKEHLFQKIVYMNEWFGLVQSDGTILDPKTLQKASLSPERIIWPDQDILLRLQHETPQNQEQGDRHENPQNQEQGDRHENPQNQEQGDRHENPQNQEQGDKDSDLITEDEDEQNVSMEKVSFFYSPGYLAKVTIFFLLGSIFFGSVFANLYKQCLHEVNMFIIFKGQAKSCDNLFQVCFLSSFLMCGRLSFFKIQNIKLFLSKALIYTLFDGLGLSVNTFITSATMNMSYLEMMGLFCCFALYIMICCFLCFLYRK